MEPTFSDGQIVRGNKVKNINDINRGDVIIIQNNKLNKISGELIKRVVALPGETITIKDGKIYIIGQLYSDYDFYPITDAGITSEGLTLKNDEFFCIGDNNAHSTDCRSFGPITFSDIRYLVEEKEKWGNYNGYIKIQNKNRIYWKKKS